MASRRPPAGHAAIRSALRTGGRIAAARVTLAEKRLELARLRTALRAVADELAGGDHRLGLATQSIQLALMEILDEVGGDDAARGGRRPGESHDFSPQQLFPVHLLGARLSG